MSLSITTAFNRLWIGTAQRDLAQGLSDFVLPVIAVTSFGASPLDVAAIASTRRLLSFGASLLLGPVVEVSPKSLLMRSCQAATALALIVVAILCFSRSPAIVILVIVSGALGALDAIYAIAHLAVVPTLVPQKAIAGAFRRLQTTDAVADSAGPAVAGILLAVTASWGAVVLAALLHLGSLFTLPRTAHELSPDSASAASAGVNAWKKFRSQALEGFVFLMRHPVLRVMTLQNVARNFGVGLLVSVETVFVLEHLKVSESHWALASSVGGACAATAAILGTALPKISGHVVIATVMGFFLPVGVCMLAFAQDASTELGKTAIVTISQAAVASIISLRLLSIAGLRSMLTPKNLRARGAAANRALLQIGFPVGALLGGVLAHATSVLSVIYMSAAAMLIGALYGIQNKWLWKKSLDEVALSIAAR